MDGILRVTLFPQFCHHTGFPWNAIWQNWNYQLLSYKPFSRFVAEHPVAEIQVMDFDPSPCCLLLFLLRGLTMRGLTVVLPSAVIAGDCWVFIVPVGLVHIECYHHAQLNHFSRVRQEMEVP
jgi:hypothetical protein